MGRARDNKARQRLGILLDLTSKQQEQRLDWQRSRNPDWTDTMILSKPKTAILSWSFAAVYDLEQKRYIHFDKAGQKKVAISSPSWYTVIKTDTTERIARNATANKARKRY